MDAFINDGDKLKQLHDEASTYLSGKGDMGLALILKTVPMVRLTIYLQRRWRIT